MTSIVLILPLCCLLQSSAAKSLGGSCAGSDLLPCGIGANPGCYHVNQKCDGTRDCSNGADETNCHGKVTVNPPRPPLNDVNALQAPKNLQQPPSHQDSSKHQSFPLNTESPKKDALYHTSIPPRSMVESRANLGWLITPVIFGLACLYVLYRCITDGICKCRRFRRLSGQAISFMHLNGISFYGFTRTHLGGDTQVTSSQSRQPLVQGDSSLPANTPDRGAPPSYEQAMQNGSLPQDTSPSVQTSSPSVDTRISTS